MAKNIFRGDSQKVPQVDSFTPANIQVGDIFTLTCNRKDLSVTATAATVANVVGLAAAAVGAYSNDIEEFKEVSAASHTNSNGEVDYLEITGPVDGTPFTITSSTTEGGISIDVVETIQGDPGQNEQQVITLPGSPTSGTFTLTFNSETTAAIAYNASAATVQAALEALATPVAGDFTVSGNAGGPWTVEFKQQYANVDVALITGDGSLLGYGAGAHPVVVQTIQQGAGGQNCVQVVNVSGESGTFTLTFNGQTTGAIAYNASAATMVTALEALSTIGVGEVSVQGPDFIGAHTYTYRIEFLLTLGSSVQPQITGDGSSLDGGQVWYAQEYTPAASHQWAQIKVVTTSIPSFNFQVRKKNSTAWQTLQFTTGMSAADMALNISIALQASPNDVYGYDKYNCPPSMALDSNQWVFEFRGGLGYAFVPDSVDTTEGGVRSPLSVTTVTQQREYSSTPVNQVQHYYNAQAVGGTYTVRIGTVTSGAIAYTASAATVQAALEAMSNVGSGNVLVTSTEADEFGYAYDVEFQGTLAGTTMPIIVIDNTNLTGGSVRATIATPGSDGTNEKQKVTLGGSPAGGTFTLTFSGATTAAIAYNATTATIVAALEALANIAVGDVAVTGSAGGPWTVEFQATYRATNVPQMTGSGASLTGGVVDVSTIQEATDVTDEVQTVTIHEATGGTFTLTYSGQTTAAIPRGASASSVQLALENLSNIDTGDVIVTGSSGGPWEVNFTSTLGGTDVSLMTASAAGLTGGGTQTFTQATVTTPHGPNWWSDAENWTAGTVPTTGDEAHFENSAISCLYGIESSSADTLAKLWAHASYTGEIGLKPYTGLYYQYRPLALKVGITQLRVGEGSGQGSPFLNFDVQGILCELLVYSTGQAALEAAVNWKGTNVGNSARIYRGSLGIALLQSSDTAVLAVLSMGFKDSQDTDAICIAGPGLTCTEVDKLGGALTMGTAPTTFKQVSGTATIADGNMTTCLVMGGSLNYNGGGTITQGRVGSGGELTFNGDMRARTVTNITLEAGSKLTDSFQTVTWTNPIVLDRCSLGEVVLDLGTHITLAIAAGP